MSKQTLKKSMADFKNTVTAYNLAVTETNNSTAYTMQGKLEQLAALKKEYKAKFADIGGKMRTEFETALKTVGEIRGADIAQKMNNAGYQASLQNAVQMIQHGAVTSKEDLRAIADTFKGDPLASSLLRGVLTESRSPEFASLIPEDKGKEAAEALAAMSNKLNSISQNAQTGDNISNYTLAFIEKCGERLDELFDDDFSLIS